MMTVDLIRNHFVIDRFICGNKLLPPPPKHFMYGKIDRKKLCFYRLLVDKNDPPPPAFSTTPIKDVYKKA